MLAAKKVIPVLKVADLRRALEFYTGILDFQICWQAANDGGGENCMLQAGAADLLLSTGSHLYMDGVQALFERIKEKVEIVWPVEVMDYGQKKFGIRDRDGNVLAFAEEV